MSCFPLCELSMCDNAVKIAEATGDVKLHVYKGSLSVCSYDLSDTGGDIILTDTEILDFADTAHVFTLQLRQGGDIINIMYRDCSDIPQEADAIRLKFNDCENENTELYEFCNPII